MRQPGHQGTAGPLSWKSSPGPPPGLKHPCRSQTPGQHSPERWPAACAPTPAHSKSAPELNQRMEEMEEGYSDGEADKESRKKDIEEKNKTTKREIEWAATERQEVSLILEHWTLTHHTDTVISNTLTYMSLMSKAEANRKKWRKKIIRENSNIRLKQVKEGRMHTIQIVRNEEDNPKVKQNYSSRKGERYHLCSSTMLHFSQYVETPFILIWKWSFCDLDIVILIIN